jgi:hypothetical protein
MSNENVSLDDLISQVSNDQPTATQATEQRTAAQAVAQVQNTAVAVQGAGQEYSLDDYLRDTAGEVGAYLKITETGVAIKEGNFTEVFLRVKVADLKDGGSFRPFVGLNNSDNGSNQFYAKSFDRGVTVSECSGDPAWVGRPWFDYVTARQVQFPSNKPYNGVAIRGQVLKATGLNGATVEAETVVGYSGTYMTSKPINTLIREILAKGLAGEDVVVRMSGKKAKSGDGKKTYAVPTFEFIGLDDGEL